MAFQLILGTSGTGKSSYAFEKMRERVKTYKSTEFYIVPEQYTMQAQEEFLSRTDSRGLLNIEVLSFNRLVYRFYDEMALVNKKSMSENGRSLMIRKIIESHLDEFIWIKKHRKKQNYMEELNTLISECYQYNIDGDKLEVYIDRIEDQLLKDKLSDIKTLLGYFKQEMKEEYITTSEAAYKLIEKIPQMVELKEVSITIDSFYGFTPLQYKFIEALMGAVKNLYVCITIDSLENLGDMRNESELFYESKKAISSLRDIAGLQKIEEIESVILTDIKREQPEGLKHINHQLFRYPVVEFKEKGHSGIRFMEGTTVDEEVEGVALRIHKLLQAGNRYKDIVVLTSEIGRYENSVKSIFEDYEFSFFLDKKEGISHHPLIQFMLSALLILQYNYRYEHVFYHLKSIYYEQTDTLNLIENYCYQRGVKSRSKWQKDWEEYNEEKSVLLSKLFRFSDQIKQGKTVGEKIKALYEYLEEVGVYESHEQMTALLEESNQLQEAVKYSKVYEHVIELLEDTYHLIGEEKLSTKEFVQLMETGLNGIQMAQTPPSVDQIIVGDISRTRFMENKYVFVLGVNEGKVPLVVNGNQLLTDRERTSLLELGLEVAPNQAKSLFKEQMNIYMSLTKATKLLHLSFARSSEEGTMRPAPIFYNLMRMFKEEKVLLAGKIIEENEDITRKKPMFYKLSSMVLGDKRFSNEQAIQKLVKFFHNEYTKGTEFSLNPQVFIDGLQYNNMAVSIDDMDIKEYNLSISELESYAACNYAHYLNYRLRLQEREEYVVTLPDIGILFHKCLELYIKKCVYKEIDIAEVNPVLRNELVDECIEEILKDPKYAIFLNNYRNKYLVVKLTRILKRALWGIEKQLRKSLLQPRDIEYNFDGTKAEMETLILRVSPNTNMFLKGVIDRVDEYENDNNNYISIIDYKSSDKTLDFGLIDSGVQLQLFVYLNVVKNIKEHNNTKKVIPSGLFYYRIQDPFVKNESENSADVEKDIMKQLKPSGLILHDESVIRLMDEDITGVSETLPVQLTKSGISSRSSTITKEQMETTLSFVHKKSLELGKGIYHGELGIKPYFHDGKTPCDYCRFKSICRFDITNTKEGYRVIDKKSQEDIIAKWEGDSNGRSD